MRLLPLARKERILYLNRINASARSVYVDRSKVILSVHATRSNHIYDRVLSIHYANAFCHVNV